ncbi:UDP-2,4-diacetamido-2,4,6-trideoxy-beta-L-altropyranose hydrolase [Moorena producens PAL-8-15-08-1]|uniref:UDP-2,4-diacetamido-2,4, 6-trideoxy-beta-L-altropyranose hydrolase n=1 Tax=Moorena producens PAL-8-15-08-1 TaxID=1458985 RepID=A0A1D8U245_9CYAN|nr:UDP-2,4-diacetamido-2,4,6-trideoxy-beta-L-altropyranose hydrolase [Moorena producens]AOX03977.1 UDP-2,4-diacetamido-2,4,6-trideoxy-beta-L-altropyranose hydrolase [Moorena producens PAL-8-15-08-1]
MEIKQNLLIRADASPKIGTGHVMRCLALAQAWLQEGGQVTLLMGTAAPTLEARLQAEGIQVGHVSVLLGSGEDAEQTITQAKALGATWVVVDGYHFGADYQRVIKEAGLRLLFIDDYGHAAHYWADLVLNQNVYAHQGLYPKRESYTQLLLGTQYTLLRKEFWPWQGWQRQIPTVARKVLVTLGGADPDNVTLKVIQALEQVKVEGLEAVVVVGGSNPHYQQLQAAVHDSEAAITLKYNVTNMPDLMAWADIAIAAGGSTCWELAFMGLPSLVVILAENQRAVADKLDAFGAAINLGWHTEVLCEPLAAQINRLLNASEFRKEMIEHGQRLVDGEGSARVLMHLQDRKLRLRAVGEDDCELLWQWANDPEVRLRSFSSKPIPWDEHVQWFNLKLKSPDCQFYMALNTQDVPIGSIRFDIEHNEATVSICINSEHRGQGYGSTLINLASTAIFINSNTTKINAYIKPDNLASIRAFLKAGFKELETVTLKDKNGVNATYLVKQRQNFIH